MATSVQRILIVGAGRGLESAARVLINRGYLVTQVADTGQARRLIGQGDYRLLLVDQAGVADADQELMGVCPSLVLGWQADASRKKTASLAYTVASDVLCREVASLIATGKPGQKVLTAGAVPQVTSSAGKGTRRQGKKPARTVAPTLH